MRVLESWKQSESGSPESGSLCYALYRSKYLHVKNIRYSFLSQLKIERGEKRVLKIRKIGKLTLEGKLVIFKKLVISKIVFQSIITTSLKHIVNELEKI